MTSAPTLIVLAAGHGARFAGPGHKLEQSLGSHSVLATTLRQALATQLPVLVVTNEDLAVLATKHVASRDVLVVSSVPGRFGMGHSIAAGVAARAHSSGWLLLPADMPLVRPASVLAVAAALAEHPVAYAQYRGRRGHPVAFAAELYSELTALASDEGARRIVARYPASGVELDDPGVLLDIDTQADLERVRATYGAALGANQALAHSKP